jgi:hypothetical protein
MKPAAEGDLVRFRPADYSGWIVGRVTKVGRLGTDVDTEAGTFRCDPYDLDVIRRAEQRRAARTAH